jgi:hypothetical protein
MTDSTAGLAETIEGLRRELTAATQKKSDDGIVFELGEAEVELQLAITKDVGADGGVRLGVVSFGARGGVASEATHRILLHLEPMMWEPDSTSGLKKLVPARVRDDVNEEPT